MSNQLTNSTEINSKTTKADLIELVKFLESDLANCQQSGVKKSAEINVLRAENTRLASELDAVSCPGSKLKKDILSLTHPVHPVKQVGHFRLKRTLLPVGSYDLMKAAVDKDLHREFATLAMRMGLTTDELQRRLAAVALNLIKN